MSNLDSKNHGWLYGKRPDAAPPKGVEDWRVVTSASRKGYPNHTDGAIRGIQLVSGLSTDELTAALGDGAKQEVLRLKLGEKTNPNWLHNRIAEELYGRREIDEEKLDEADANGAPPKEVMPDDTLEHSTTRVHMNGAPSEPPPSDAAPVARDMICESHPWLPWPHGKCGGPGCPVGAKDLLLRDRISGLQQAVKQRETMIADFYYATEDAPVKSAVHQIPDKRCPECVLKIGDADGTQVESANDFLEHGGHFDGCSRKRLVHKQNCRTRIDPECGICDCE